MDWYPIVKKWNKSQACGVNHFDEIHSVGLLRKQRWQQRQQQGTKTVIRHSLCDGSWHKIIVVTILFATLFVVSDGSVNVSCWGDFVLHVKLWCLVITS
jgi:hypothetical protein